MRIKNQCVLCSPGSPPFLDFMNQKTILKEAKKLKRKFLNYKNAWNKRNPDKIKAYNQSYYKKNRKRILTARKIAWKITQSILKKI